MECNLGLANNEEMSEGERREPENEGMFACPIRGFDDDIVEKLKQRYMVQTGKWHKIVPI
jgi:hypothetical protein